MRANDPTNDGSQTAPSRAQHTPGETSGSRKGFDDAHASERRPNTPLEHRQPEPGAEPTAVVEPAQETNPELKELGAMGLGDEGPGSAEGHTDNEAGG